MKNFLIPILFLALFTTCDKDPCDNIICDKGYCVNGTCECDTGYTGADCSKEKVPSKMAIKKITIKSFPETDTNGDYWDLISGADVYPKLSHSIVELYTPTTYFENATSGVDYEFYMNVDILSPRDAHVIEIYDFDSLDNDDWICDVVFAPYQWDEGFPEVYTLESDNCKIEVEVSYEFD